MTPDHSHNRSDWDQVGLVEQRAVWRSSAVFVLAALFFFALPGLLVADLLGLHIQPTVGIALGLVCATVSLTLFCVSFMIRRHAEQSLRWKRLRRWQRKADENPHEAMPAWEIAKANLEEYLKRNLAEIALIFYLTVIVMAVGFGTTIYGVHKAFGDPANFRPSLVAACSGVLIEFIGATFLFIYRSTMKQARDYVSVLERINAVGMSMQILDSIQDSQTKLKDKARADLAMQLLRLYSPTCPPDEVE